jgi:hypothetical protein
MNDLNTSGYYNETVFFTNAVKDYLGNNSDDESIPVSNFSKLYIFLTSNNNTKI